MGFEVAVTNMNKHTTNNSRNQCISISRAMWLTLIPLLKQYRLL